MHKSLAILLLITCMSHLCLSGGVALATDEEDPYAERMSYYERYEALALIPWYYLAAVDQYERNIQKVRRDIPTREGVVAIQFSDDFWVGTLNPNTQDTSSDTILFFGGKGLDGNGDGLADRANDEDVMYTLSQILSKYGTTRKDFRIALWEYYREDQTVNVIDTLAELYRHFQSIDLDKKAFPLDLKYNYSYHSTWGDRRGWGGRRIHEGTDLFADYGTPVRATTHGKVEIKGWNKFGGWRIGIRDAHNNYHYFAHLSRFEDNIGEGDIVEPGTIIGYVGSSGYGKPGTSGKFPPHLHYGIYKYNGNIEWSYDPYPHIRQWEKQEKQRR